MIDPLPYPIRNECPPGLCICERDGLLADPQGDKRVLRLTREEEKRLIARIDTIEKYEELRRLQQQLVAKLGVEVHILPGLHEVRTVRGFSIQLEARPGLCRKTREAVPAAIRRCLDRHPEIAFAILDEHGLFGAG